MPKKYEIRPKNILHVSGETLTPDDVLAVIEMQVDCNPRDVLDMVLLRTANLICTDPEPEELDDAADEELEGDEVVDDGGDDGGDDGEEAANPFASLTAQQQESLAVEGITTLAQAALWLATHKSFESLDAIGKKTNLELVELIREAGLPVPDKYN